MENNIIVPCFYVVIGVIIIIFAGWSLYNFFKWTQNITKNENGSPNAIIGFHVVYESIFTIFMALLVIGALILFLNDKNPDIASLVLGLSAGAVLTRTPSFQQKPQDITKETHYYSKKDQDDQENIK